MKTIIKVLLVLAFFLASNQTSEAQDFKAKTNLVLFGGYSAEQQNINNNSWYTGLYGDWMVLKSSNDRWTFGPYLIFTRSSFTQNLTRYSGRNWEAGGGLILGYYSENFSQNRELFLGSAIGVKEVLDQGKSSSRWLGNYKGEQEDLLLVLNLNFNVFKRARVGSTWLPRSQIQLNFQKSLTSNKEATWNNFPIMSAVWDKAYYEVLAKQSICDWGWSQSLFCSPKIIGLSSYSYGSNEHNYGLGGEISLHKSSQDDFFSVYCIYKISGISEKNVFMTGLSLNLSSL
jgi:hypothetical protein